jgi:hypothetical protein
MSDTFGRRFAAMSGLALAAVFAVWWLGSMRLAIDRGSDAGRGSADALQIAWLVRALIVPVLAMRIGALRGWRAGAVASLAIVAPSWPVVAMAWSASSAALAQTVLAEAILLAAAVVLPLTGPALRRVLPRPDLVAPIASCLGVALAAGVWFGHDRWPTGF